MKKFAFTLEAVARYKDTVEKKQKSDLARAEALLRQLREEEESVLAAQANCADSLSRALQDGRDIPREMERHDLYQQFLRECLEELRLRIAQANAEKKRIQALLIITMKEQKTLARLREEQYAAYLEESRQEEDKLLGDLISHRATVVEE